MQAWAILSNHYHFIAKAPEGANTLSKLIRQVHSISAIQLNQWNKTSVSQVWFNYWDTCLSYKKPYPARLHYVLINPVKQRYIDDAMNYPYCGYRWFIEHGEDDLKNQVFAQPIDRINMIDDF